MRNTDGADSNSSNSSNGLCMSLNSAAAGAGGQQHHSHRHHLLVPGAKSTTSRSLDNGLDAIEPVMRMQQRLPPPGGAGHGAGGATLPAAIPTRCLLPAAHNLSHPELHRLNHQVAAPPPPPSRHDVDDYRNGAHHVPPSLSSGSPTASFDWMVQQQYDETLDIEASHESTSGHASAAATATSGTSGSAAANNKASSSYH